MDCSKPLVHPINMTSSKSLLFFGFSFSLSLTHIPFLGVFVSQLSNSLSCKLFDHIISLTEDGCLITNRALGLEW